MVSESQLIDELGALIAGTDLNNFDSQNSVPAPISDELQAWFDAQIAGNPENVGEVKKALTSAFVAMKREGCAPEGIPDSPEEIALKVDIVVEKIRNYVLMAKGEIELPDAEANIAERTLSTIIVAIENFAKKHAPELVEMLDVFLQTNFGAGIPEPVKDFLKVTVPTVIGKVAEFLQKNKPEIVRVVKSFFERAKEIIVRIKDMIFEGPVVR